MERLKRIIIVIGSIFGLLIGLIKIYKQEDERETIRSSDRYDQEVYDDCGGDGCGWDDCSDCRPVLQNGSIEEREISAPREVKHKRRIFRFTKLHVGNKRDRSKKG